MFFCSLRLFLGSPGVFCDEKVRERVSVDEIGKSLVLIGRLGVPLGEKLEITGR